MKKLLFMAAGLCVLVSGVSFTATEAQAVVVTNRGGVAVGRPAVAPRAVVTPRHACAMRNVRVRVNGVWVTRAQRVCT